MTDVDKQVIRETKYRTVQYIKASDIADNWIPFLNSQRDREIHSTPLRYFLGLPGPNSLIIL